MLPTAWLYATWQGHTGQALLDNAVTKEGRSELDLKGECYLVEQDSIEAGGIEYPVVALTCMASNPPLVILVANGSSL